METSSTCGKVAIITGASSGIGRGVAVNFSKQGCRLVLCGRDLTALMLTKGLCSAQGLKSNDMIHVQADMTKDSDIQSIMDKTIEKFGRLDIIFHNAGTCRASPPVENVSMDQYHYLWKVNVDSIVFLTKLAIPFLEKTKGCIVMDSSISGKNAMVGIWEYNMTKSALDHFCRSLALDLAPKGIRVNNVNPGCIITNLHMGAMQIPPEYYDYMLEKIGNMHALGRCGDVTEVASLVSFLVSDKCEQTTGVCVSVDGGQEHMFNSIHH